MGDSGDNIPSNEKIVDDLINQIKDTQINEEQHSTDPDTLEKLIAENDGNEDESETEKTDTKKSLLDDFIDEEKMKEEEQELDEDEKMKRKQKSDELKQEGNEKFKSGEYLESVNIYTSALRICPLNFTKERSILYSNRSASKIKLEYNETALDDCKKAVELNPEYVKALLRRAKLYETMEKLDESLEDYKKLQVMDPDNNEYKHMIFVLGQRIEKRNEEMKTEMLGKLKDLGNLILKPFGLSTENFQLNQDPNSGGYSVNFMQKK